MVTLSELAVTLTLGSLAFCICLAYALIIVFVGTSGSGDKINSTEVLLIKSLI